MLTAAMSKLSVQPDHTASNAPSEAALTNAVTKEMVVIPKVKREPLAEQTQNAKSEDSANPQTISSSKHAKPPRPTSAGSTRSNGEVRQAQLLPNPADFASCISTKSVLASASIAVECSIAEVSEHSSQHESYDMRFRGTPTMRSMLEAINEGAPPVLKQSLDSSIAQVEAVPVLAAIEDMAIDDDAPREHLAPPTSEPQCPPTVEAPACGGTLVMFDQVFREHRTGKGCQECPERVDILCGHGGSLTSPNAFPVAFEQNLEEASLADILRVHEWEYVAELKRKCAAMSGCKQGSEQAFACLDPPGHPQDTNVSELSFKVAATAAGAVCRAVDRVMSGSCHNAFVAARPPGHHAGPRGLVHTDDGRPSLSQGFCLLNSVAIGAAYCKYNYRKMGVERIAIVDFDIHNGDGTAACVRNLTPHSETRRVGPGTEVKSVSYKPWLDDSDSDQVLFASLHLCAPNFYPRMAHPDAGGAPEWELLSTGRDNDATQPNILNIPLRKTTCKADAAALWRSEVQTQLLPRLTSFEPDFILLSAGFDGHAEDVKGNQGLFHLVEDDYHWLTARLCEIAERCCAGRLVSVLEGGYHVERPAPPAPRISRRKSTAVPASSTAVSMPGALATSVSAHVRALQEASEAV